jgi:hypothetical protein
VATDDWVTVGDYPNESCAKIASALLTGMDLPLRIRPNSRDWPGAIPRGVSFLIYVAPGLAAEAKRILSETSISDAELTAQALADPPPDDA